MALSVELIHAQGLWRRVPLMISAVSKVGAAASSKNGHRANPREVRRRAGFRCSDRDVATAAIHQRESRSPSAANEHLPAKEHREKFRCLPAAHQKAHRSDNTNVIEAVGLCRDTALNFDRPVQGFEAKALGLARKTARLSALLNMCRRWRNQTAKSSVPCVT